MLRLLLIHENPSVHLLIRQELDSTFTDLVVEIVTDATGLTHALNQRRFDLAITDAALSWSDGLTVLHHLKGCYPCLPVIMLTDCNQVDVAVAAMKAGLEDYLVTATLTPGRLLAAVQATLQPRPLSSHATLEALIQAAPLAITVLDRSGVVQIWNPAAERIFGWTAAETLGRQMPTIPEDKQQEFLANIEVTLQGEPLKGLETQRQRKDGTAICVGIWTAVLRNHQGEADSLMSIVADITERKQAEAERDRALALEQAAREQAETVNRLKDEFLTILSHELRSPLNSVLGWSQLLRKRKLNEATTVRALETIERNARAQTQLVEDLLDMSRIIQGKLSLNIHPVQLPALIERVIETVCPAATAKNIQLVTRLISLEPIAADGDRLQQVIWNLLSNALKFTPVGGRVEVELRLAEARCCSEASPASDQSSLATLRPNCIQILVRDTGQGIAADFLPYVFDRFRQADSKTTRRHGGLGLGLAIVRHLVELHGGTVSVSSPGEGQGATFTVTLPVNLPIAPEVRSPEQLSLPASWTSPPIPGGTIYLEEENTPRIRLHQSPNHPGTPA